MTSSDKNLRYISTCIVRPAGRQADERTPKKIDLTVWDLTLLPHQYMQRGLLYTKPTPVKYHYSNQEEEESINNIITHLKNSLAKTLDHFYPFAGRLATTIHDDNEDTRYSVYINCDSSGAEFIHATMGVSVADIINPIYVPLDIVRSFFSLEGVLNYHGLSKPLLSIQVTELIDGIFVGCSINHTVCDGTSFWHFFNSWSEMCKGGGDGSNHDDHISRQPILERWFPKNIDFPPIRLPFFIGDENFAERYKYIPPPSFEVRIFHFTRENIIKLKSKANLEQTESIENKNYISSFQALLSHIWLAVTRARCLGSKDEDTSYQLVIGNRARLNPPLPDGYFGSSFMIRETTAKVSELLERGISCGALLLKKLVNSYDDAAIQRYCETWVEKPVLHGRRVPVSTTLMTGGSPRFNMHGNDFGWGQPIAVRGGISNKRQGKITAIPGPVEGSIDLEVCFSLDMLKAMADDPEFMEAVTVLPPYKSV
ncbi:hypothetical protein MKW92_017917 [Papaver armeniacum]|nr:hypothetical protein MKW92_017917 [Papaver armeniacum]